MRSWRWPRQAASGSGRLGFPVFRGIDALTAMVLLGGVPRCASVSDGSAVDGLSRAGARGALDGTPRSGRPRGYERRHSVHTASPGVRSGGGARREAKALRRDNLAAEPARSRAGLEGHSRTRLSPSSARSRASPPCRTGFESSFRNWASQRTNHPHGVVATVLAHVIANQPAAGYAGSDPFERGRRRVPTVGSWQALERLSRQSRPTFVQSLTACCRARTRGGGGQALLLPGEPG